MLFRLARQLHTVMRRPNGRQTGPRGWLIPAMLAALVLTSPTFAEEKDAPAEKAKTRPVLVGPSPGLTQCIQIALEKQPALVAARASLNAAQLGPAALSSIRGIPRFLAKDLPVREQQASVGIQAKEADVWQTEWDTVANVSRAYWLVVFTREQKALVEETLLNTELVSRSEKAENSDVLPARALWRITNATLRARLAEADVGVRRAEATLRETMGVGPDCPLSITETALPDLYMPTVSTVKNGEEKKTTAVVVLPITRESAVALALERRGELAQAKVLASATELEIAAQGALLRRYLTSTFAAGSDIHVRPVPTGDRGREFRPGAIGPEMPVSLAGNQHFRMERATALSERAGAVVEKTTRLVTLEAEEAYLRLEEATRKVAEGRIMDDAGLYLVRPEVSEFIAGESEVQQARTASDLLIRGTQSRAQYTEYLLLQLSLLAEMQRITAGGFCPPFAPSTPAPAPAPVGH